MKAILGYLRDLLAMELLRLACFVATEEMELQASKDAAKVLVEALARIMSGLTTQQSEIERMTKAEAHDALVCYRKAIGETE